MAVTGDPGGQASLSALVVEESNADAIAIERALARGGFAPAIARVGSARALQTHLEQVSWDVVLCDVAIPGFEGLEALRMVRQRDPDVPFIIVSEAIGGQAAVDAMRSGANDYVPKGSLERLVPAIRRELAASAERRAARALGETWRPLARRLQAIARTANDWLWTCDREARITTSGGAGHDVLGYTEAEFIGMRCFDLIHPDDRAAAEADHRACIDEGRGWVGAVRRWKARDGRYMFLESAGVPDVAEDGTLVGMCGTRRDITGRMLAEQRLSLVADRQFLIAEISRALAESSRDPDRLIEVAATRVVEALGDGCAIFLVGDDGEARLAGGAHSDPAAEHALRQAITSGPILDREGLVGRAVATRRPVRVGSPTDGISSQMRPHLQAAIRDAGVRFAVAVPLEHRDTLVGVLVLGRSRDVDYTDDEVQFLEDLATHLAVGVGNAAADQELKVSQRERMRLLAKLVGAQETERRRIASDMHDDAIQVVAALALRLDLLGTSMTDAHQAAQVETIRQLAQGVLARLRTLIFDLHPPALERSGLVAAVRQRLEILEAESGIAWDLENGLTAELTWEARVVLYRIAQEALANVKKHSGATKVLVRLSTADGGTHLEMEDDGVGLRDIDAHTWRPLPGHLGIATMRERAELVGGTLTLSSHPGGGTKVVCWVPEDSSEAGAT